MLGAAVVLVAGVCSVIAFASADQPAPGSRATAVSTEQVQRGPLSAQVSGAGTLTYRARADGAPYAVINQAHGVFTQLPEGGEEVGCGSALYRVDDKPVVLLCGPIPAYRALRLGLKGQDVRELNRNLHELGYDVGAHVRIDPSDDAFTSATEQALGALQRKLGLDATGELALADAVFLPGAIRIAKVIAQVGGLAQPGDAMLNATSVRLYVRLELEASQQGEVKKGDRAQITLPGNTPVPGRVTGFGAIAQAEQGTQPAAATIPTFVELDNPAAANGLAQAPVEVSITTKGVENALSVPVTALVGKSGGGFAVEVVHGDGQREMVAVKLGLFDTGGGRVQVEGDLREGDSVVVPSI